MAFFIDEETFLVGLIAITAIFGGLGFLLRSGIEGKEALKNALQRAESDPNVVIDREKFDNVNKSSTIKISISILGLLLIYGLILAFLPGLFLMSLFFLLPFFMGIFGFFFRIGI